MSKAYGQTAFVVAGVLLLVGCSPESFKVAPCSLNGQLAFRIYSVDGFFSDYVPRPTSVVVGKADGTHEWPGMWSAELKLYGDRDAYERKLKIRRLLVYGEQLPQWELSQAAKPLRKGAEYWVRIDGGRGHHGWAQFTAGDRMPACS